jgi:hypothetical protein
VDEQTDLWSRENGAVTDYKLRNGSKSILTSLPRHNIFADYVLEFMIRYTYVTLPEHKEIDDGKIWIH